jgi:hypothetical protein
MWSTRFLARAYVERIIARSALLLHDDHDNYRHLKESILLGTLLQFRIKLDGCGVCRCCFVGLRKSITADAGLGPAWSLEGEPLSDRFHFSTVGNDRRRRPGFFWTLESTLSWERSGF